MNMTCTRYVVMKDAIVPTLLEMNCRAFSNELVLMNSIICSYVIRPASGRINIFMCIRIMFIYMIFFCMLDFVSLSISIAARSTKNGIITTLTSTRTSRGANWLTKRIIVLSSSIGPPPIAVLYTISGVTRKSDRSTRMRHKTKLFRHEIRGFGFNSFQLMSFQWKAF